MSKFKKIKEIYKNKPRLVLKNFQEIKKDHEKIIKFGNIPHFHLFAYSGLINDPNGLGKVGDTYHIYYQWSPFTPHHINKHWGHFTTKDFVNYKHDSNFLSPTLDQEKDGCFSGTMIKIDGIHKLVYTGNVKNSDNTKTSFTLSSDIDMKNKKVLFEVDKNSYTGNFRDPAPMWKNNQLYLLHGAQSKDLKGKLNYYKKNQDNFLLMGNIDLGFTTDGYMIECPSYFSFPKISRDFFALSIEGEKFNTDFDKSVVFVSGILDLEKQKLINSKKQPIDFGRSFYAPQIFQNDFQNIMIGWFGMSEFEDIHNIKSGWANALTMPRELIFKNDHIYQKPIKAMYSLIGEKIEINNHFYLNAKKISKFLNYKFIGAKGFFEINISKNNFSLDISKSYNPNLESINGKKISPKININKQINNFEIWIDETFLEIFINDGEYVITERINVGKFKQVMKNGNPVKVNLVNEIKIEGEW